MAQLGVLIVACGRPNYGAMAFNLAVSLRVANPDLPIAVGYTEPHTNSSGHALPNSLSWLNERQRAVFTDFVEVKEDMYNLNGVTQYGRVKTFTYWLSPYTETLALDADTAWSYEKQVEDVIAGYREYPFTAMNYLHKACGDAAYQAPKHQYTFWADDVNIARVWGVQGRRIYQIQSSFYFFTKGKKGEAFFKVVREAYDHPRLTGSEMPPKWADGIPDEYAFNVATAVTGLELHESPYHPFFVPYTMAHTREVKTANVAKGWAGISMAGNRIDSQPMHSMYNTLVAYGCRKLGMASHWPYRLLEKVVHQPERSVH